MSRLTRQESQQLTRHNLIEAAEKEIIRVGIFEASIRQICESAGYTLGAFYSNFKDKDELLLEVLEIHTKNQFDVFKNLIKLTANQEERKVIGNIAKWLRNMQDDRIFTSLSIEFELYAHHYDTFKSQFYEKKQRWHSELALILEAIFKGQGLKPKILPIQMALGLYALWIGFAIEGSATVESADKVIPVFLEALLESSKR